jgi:hypothetical protein
MAAAPLHPQPVFAVTAHRPSISPRHVHTHTLALPCEAEPSWPLVGRGSWNSNAASCNHTTAALDRARPRVVAVFATTSIRQIPATRAALIQAFSI